MAADDVASKIHEYFSQFPHRSYPKGQILIFANESPEYIYYLVGGKVRQYAVSYRGDEVIVNIFKPPAFFPMSWAINNTENDFFYKTEEPTELYSVPAEKALEFIKQNPDVMFDLLGRVYRGADGLLGRIVHLMSGTAKSRLIYELLVECHRFGKRDEQGRCELQVNEGDLAARSGLSRETVSREIQKLKDNNLVSLAGKTLSVSDVAELEKLLGAAT